MNVLIATPAWFALGGMSRVIESWARILSVAGHRVIVTTRATGAAEPFPALPGVCHAPFRSESREGHPAKRFRELRALLRAVEEVERRSSVDVFVSHDTLLTAALRRAFPGRPVLTTLHSPSVDENRLNNWKYTRDPIRRATYPATWALSWWIDRRGLEAASLAHTLSRYTWSLLSKRYPRICARLPWRRIPGTFDETRFRPAEDREAVRASLGLDPSEIVLLTVRRLVPRNGVDRILACAERLRGSNVRFLIGGSGALEGELRARAEVERLDAVTFLGRIEESRLAACYQAADGFLLPTRDLECFGLPAIEAMGCGCPPLVMPDGGPAEVCEAFPDWTAAENSTEAFVRLVCDFVARKPSAPRADLVRHARDTYSEAAVAGSVRRAVEGLL